MITLGAACALLGCGSIELRDRTPEMVHSSPLNAQRFQASVTATGDYRVREVLLHHPRGVQPMTPADGGQWQSLVAIGACDRIVNYRYTVRYSDADRPHEPPPFRSKAYPDVGSYTREVRDVPAQCDDPAAGGPRAFSVTTTADGSDERPGDGVCRDAAGECTLRAAVMESNALPGTDVIELGKGIYELSRRGREGTTPDASVGDLDITGSVVIRQAGACRLTLNHLFVLPKQGEALGDDAYDARPDAEIAGRAVTIDAKGIDRVFEIVAGGNETAQVQLQCLQVRGGVIPDDDSYPGERRGAGILNRGTLSLERVVVADNELQRVGRGVGIFNGGQLRVQNSAIFKNRNPNPLRDPVYGGASDPAALGGGLYNRGRAALDQVLIAMNEGSQGSGILNIGAESDGDADAHATITNTTIAKNPTSFIGLVIGTNAVDNSGVASLSWTTIESDRYAVINTNRLTLANSVIYGGDFHRTFFDWEVTGPCFGVNPRAASLADPLAERASVPLGRTSSLGGNHVTDRACLASSGLDKLLPERPRTRLEYRGGFAPVLVELSDPVQPGWVDGSITAVDCPAIDQRGYPRPARGFAGTAPPTCDSGAFELHSVPRVDVDLPPPDDPPPVDPGDLPPPPRP